ncbi:GNAT family N-acetyltransferase [Streptomyces phaeochromogenes]
MNTTTSSAPTASIEIVSLNRGNRVIGQLRFRVCKTCRAGRILDIWICDTWQGQGLGRELIHSLLARRPGYRWSTTLQSRAGRGFFTAMARKTTVALPRGGPLCSHLTGWFRRHGSVGWKAGRSAEATCRQWRGSWSGSRLMPALGVFRSPAITCAPAPPASRFRPRSGRVRTW